ncbi:MAG: DUF5688 family protein [Clostridiales bacterium]|nr:DUF5688 family protein [Clostridiales bacterium]
MEYMGFAEFALHFENWLQALFSEIFDVYAPIGEERELRAVWKGSGNSPMAFRFNLTDFYRLYLEGEPLSSVLGRMEELLRKAIQNNLMPECVNVINSLSAFERVKDKFFIRVINYRQNVDSLKGKTCKRLGDMAITLYVLIPGQEKTDTMYSIKVPTTFAREWGLSVGQAIQAGLANSKTLFPPRMLTQEQMAYGNENSASRERFNFMSEGFRFQKSILDAYIVTNARIINGASVIFYPGALQRLSEIFKGDYFFACISVHEVILRPIASYTLKEMKKWLSEMSANPFISLEERLSSSLYKYDRKSNSIMVF